MAGHIVRLDHNRWAHSAMIWDPRSESRRPGKSTTRWTEDIKKQDVNLWTRTARIRDD